MQLWELFLIAVGLSMDAFAVAICKGLSVPRATPRHALTVGYLLGSRLESLITSVDHWIAFLLLGFIGVNMIREGRSGCDGEEELSDSFGFRAMLPLAVATSIDALAVGITFAFLRVDIVPAVSFIGVITFCLSAVGVLAGNKLGSRFQARAQLLGGAVLILMGCKILLEHLGILG